MVFPQVAILSDADADRGVAPTPARGPQAFGRARLRLEDGREAEGAAAELLVPKWFDKNPALSDEENLDQLRSSLALARDAYLAGGGDTGFGHSTHRPGAPDGLRRGG